MRLQAIWDARLRASGFLDIESGSDLNMIDGSTFRRASAAGDRGVEVTIGYVHSDERILPDAEREYGTGIEVRDSDGALEKALPGGGARVVHRTVFDSPRARAWMRFSQAAHELPTDAEMRSILIDVADTGSLTESAARNRVSERTVYDRMTRLCAAIGIDRRCLLSAPMDAAEAQPEPVVNPARRLTKREIKRLHIEPPRERKAS